MTITEDLPAPPPEADVWSVMYRNENKDYPTPPMPNRAAEVLVCPHCQTKGFVTTRRETVKQGISGGKATAAILTSGLSLFATGLAKMTPVTKAFCSHCASSWEF